MNLKLIAAILAIGAVPVCAQAQNPAAAKADVQKVVKIISSDKAYDDGFRPGDPVMRQREFVMLVGAAAVGWPFAARAQQPAKLPAIGFLGPNSATFDKAH